MADFKKGDIVELKSGGPAMTIYEIDKECVYCMWFKENERDKGGFDPEALKLLPEHGR